MDLCLLDTRSKKIHGESKMLHIDSGRVVMQGSMFQFSHDVCSWVFPSSTNDCRTVLPHNMTRNQ